VSVISQLRVRMSNHDAHYGGHLVDGARILGLFGDVATELCIAHDGDEGLFRAYDSVEAEGEITEVGKTSRKMRFEARKVIRPLPEVSDSAAELLGQPVVVCRATGTCVVPLNKQRVKR